MKLKSLSLTISTALLAGGLMASQAAVAKGRLVVYCSATNILCETTTKAFGEKYDVKTSFIRNGSGSTFAKVEAEKNVKYKLVIDEIVKAEKIKADKKFIKEEIENIAKQYGQDAKEIESRKDIIEYLENASKNSQAVKFIVDNAKISK